MTLVIDASMALAWMFERQQASDAERASRLLAACGEKAWWVPGLWHLEVANALVVAERRGVIAPSASDLFLARLSSLPICTEAEATRELQSRVIPLARSHSLSSYDATYLDLALRLNATLASFDRRLIQSAADLGVTTYQ